MSPLFLLQPEKSRIRQIVYFCYRCVHLHMCHSGIDEHRLLKCGTPRQIAADRESNTFNYYSSTTTQNSKNAKCLYAA